MHDGREARHAETRVGGVASRAVFEGLIAQAMAPLPAESAGARRRAIGTRQGAALQYVSCPPRHIAADLGQGSCPLLVLDELSAKLLLEFACLHPPDRPANRTFLGGTPKVAVTGQGIKISKLAQCEHRLQLSARGRVLCETQCQNQSRSNFSPISFIAWINDA